MPEFWGAIVGGKLYTYSTEHSPNTPIYKDGKIRCIDAFNGTEIWTLAGYGGTHASNTQVAAAEGFLVFLNSYDMQIYSVGRGPSATTVSIQNDVITYGGNTLVKGTIMDIAAGTKQKEQTARFPNGVAAVSDLSMSEWMEYVYMQKPKPVNATGVEVTLDVLDANGNYRNIGTTTSDANGFYSFNWQPDIAGKYTVIASFQGSQSYWPSHAETAFIVNEAAPTPTSQPITALPPTEMYIVGVGVAMVIAIAIVGAVLALMIRKRP